MEEVFTCDITDFDNTLGFVMRAEVYGLKVSHILPDYVIEAQKAALSMNDTNKSKLMTSKMSKAAEESQKAEETTKEQKNDLKSLKFPSCTINKPSSQRFILRNMSGIKTTFSFRPLEFEPDDLVLPANIQGKSSLDDLQDKDVNESLTISKPGSKTSKRETKIRFALSTRTKKGLKVKQLKRALLTDSHEHLNKFQSKTGETFTATKRLEREQAFYLSSNKGLAIVFHPNYGDLRPHEEIPVNVTIYNNACGRFEDTFISEIKGLPPFKFPIYVTINGSPLIIPENQVGLNYFTNPPTMAFPTVVDQSPQLSRTFKIKNTGIADVVIDWKMFDQKDEKEKDQEADLFNISIGKNTGFDSEENPYKLKFDLNEPEPSEDSPFKIDPPVAVIPAREIQVFEVKFNSDQGVDKFRSVLLAHPQLLKDYQESTDQNDQSDRGKNIGLEENKVEEVTKGRRTLDLYDYNSDSSLEDDGTPALSQDNQNIDDGSEKPETERAPDSDHDSTKDAVKRDLGIVALKLFAQTIEPVLSVDMKQKLDGEFYFNFHQWPMNHEDEPSDVEKICLVNETKANLVFNMKTEGPFEIVGSKTNSGSVHPLAPTRPASKGINAKAITMFNLQPDKIVQIKVKFSPPNPKDHLEWPVVQSFVKKGLLNVEFVNGKSQNFNLLGNLLRPKVNVYTEKPCKNEKGVEEINLGEVNIENFKLSHFYLNNLNAVPARWALNYVKFPKKATIGYMTKTPLEIENMKK